MIETAMIAEENEADFLEFLSTDELFGIDEGRFSGLGAYDGETNEPMGILIAEILPDYIRLRKLYTLPKYRRKGVATTLLGIATDLPDDVQMPILFATEKEVNTKYLESKGFMEEKGPYSFVRGTLADVRVLPISKNDMDVFDVCPMSRVAEKDVLQFIATSPRDAFLQFPEGVPDIERFNDSGLVCLKKGAIEACLLTEDFDDAIQITWMHGKNKEALYSLLSQFYELLREDLSPEDNLRILCYNAEQEKTCKKMFGRAQAFPISIYKLKDVRDK